MLNKYFQPGEKVKIYPKRNDGNISYISQIDEINEEEIIVLAPIKLGRVLPLNLGKDFIFDFYTTNGIFRTVPDIYKRSKKDNLYLLHLLVDKEELRKIQRRDYYRIDCVVPFYIEEYINNEEKNAEIINIHEEATIVNISGGGFKFLSKHVFEIGTTIKSKIKLRIKGQTSEVQVEGKIVASEPLFDNTNRFMYRLRFVNIPAKVREQIIKFVFEQQVKQKDK